MEGIGLRLLYIPRYYVRRKILFSSPKYIFLGAEGQRMNVLLEEEATSVSFLVDHETVVRSLTCLG